MLKACSGCGKIHKPGECSLPVPERYSKERDSKADKFRNTQKWRRKSKQIMKRDKYCCRVCLSAGIINNRELSVHHIRPLVKDYDKRLDDDNLITLCRYHHEMAESGHIRCTELEQYAVTHVVPSILK